jgi:hypothetical protein
VAFERNAGSAHRAIKMVASATILVHAMCIHGDDLKADTHDY